MMTLVLWSRLPDGVILATFPFCAQQKPSNPPSQKKYFPLLHSLIFLTSREGDPSNPQPSNLAPTYYGVSQGPAIPHDARRCSAHPLVASVILTYHAADESSVHNARFCGQSVPPCCPGCSPYPNIEYSGFGTFVLSCVRPCQKRRI